MQPGEIELTPEQALEAAFAAWNAGDSGGAEHICRRILAVVPKSFDAWSLLGAALHATKRHEEAVSCFQQACALRADNAEARNNLAAGLYELGRHAEALAACEAAIALQPDNASAHYNQGLALEALDRPDEAIAGYEQAIALRGQYPEALAHRAAALRRLGRFEEAIEGCDQALSLWPDNAQLWFTRGAALEALNRLAPALESFDRTLALAPHHGEALNRRAYVLRALGRQEEALASFEHALAAGAAHPDTLGEAAACAMTLCDWAARARLAEAFLRRTGDEVFAPGLAMTFSDDPALHHRVAAAYVRANAPEQPNALWRKSRDRGEKIRIAYLSADFRQHPVGFLLETVLANHDRDRFEIHGVSYGPDDQSAVRARLIGGFDAFHDVRSLSDREAAERIAGAGADIVIDLMGHTYRARMGILSHRPAPVQVSYLGFPGTTGAGYIDYILADRTTAPFDQQPFYSEKIVHLDGCYLPGGAWKVSSARVPSRIEAGLPEEGFVFCCFNALWKITPDVFAVWMRLLDRTKGSVLWLSFDNAAAMQNLRDAARAHGVDPGRLVFKQRAPFDEHLALHSLADLFVDTLPYNAHATATDALWAGLPIVTCRGPSFAGRVAASVLEAAGLPDLVTADLAAYEALAAALAHDPGRLAKIKASLAANRDSCALFNSARYVRGLEATLETLWRGSGRANR